jgi:hypothetical protein
MNLEKIKNVDIDKLDENTYLLNWSENNGNSIYNDLVEVQINLKDGSASFTRFGVTGHIIDKYDGNFNHVYSDK